MLATLLFPYNLVRQLNFIFVVDADSLHVISVLELYLEYFVLADRWIPESWQVVLKAKCG